MSLGRSDFERLQRDARNLSDDAKPYLQRARDHLRNTTNPVDTLALLHVLWDSPYANRPDQKATLDAVGQWFEQRLRRDPAVSCEHLRLEIGWLRRIVVAGSSERRAQEQTKANAPQQGRKQQSQPPRHRNRKSKQTKAAFGSNIDHLYESRERAKRLSGPASNAGEPEPAQSVRLEVPATLQVCLAPEVLKDARKLAKKRIDKGKAPKDKLLALRPADPAFLVHTTDLYASLLHTDGMDELGAAIDANAGVMPPLYWRRDDIADDIPAHKGKRVARRLHLTPPADQE